MGAEITTGGKTRTLAARDELHQSSSRSFIGTEVSKPALHSHSSCDVICGESSCACMETRCKGVGRWREHTGPSKPSPVQLGHTQAKASLPCLNERAQITQQSKPGSKSKENEASFAGEAQKDFHRAYSSHQPLTAALQHLPLQGAHPWALGHAAGAAAPCSGAPEHGWEPPRVEGAPLPGEAAPCLAPNTCSVLPLTRRDACCHAVPHSQGPNAGTGQPSLLQGTRLHLQAAVKQSPRHGTCTMQLAEAAGPMS